jgi:hypothetical protein
MLDLIVVRYAAKQPAKAALLKETVSTFMKHAITKIDTRISKLQEHFRKADGVLTSAWNKEKLAWFEKE